MTAVTVLLAVLVLFKGGAAFPDAVQKRRRRRMLMNVCRTLCIVILALSLTVDISAETAEEVQSLTGGDHGRFV